MISNLAEGVRAFTSNAFLVSGERTTLIDAGADFDVISRIEDRVDALDAVVMTHTHPDHVGNLDAVKSHFGVEAWGYDTEQDGIDTAIPDEGTVRIGDYEYRALHTPGHKNDHLCFYASDPEILFAGDLIFQNGSFGRTDLAEGDHDALIESIDRVAGVVDEDLAEMHVGHGASITNEPYGHVELAAEMARQAR